MIKIQVKAAEKVNGELSAFIQFPYDAELVNLMRQQNNRFWHAPVKQWEISLKNLPSIIKGMKGRKVEIIGDYKAMRPVEIKVPNGFKFKTEPFGHQIEGFNYGLANDRFLLADEQGLGKTKQVIDIAIAKKLSKGYKHCLIICGVNGLNGIGSLKSKCIVMRILIY